MLRVKPGLDGRGPWRHFHAPMFGLFGRKSRMKHTGRLKMLSEKDAKLAQKLGERQPLIAAVFPQECTGQLASFGPTYANNF